MRIINIDLSQDTRCPQKVFGGNAREHNESKLVVKLPERMLRDDISYYYFEFQTVLGEHIVSPNIDKNRLLDGNKASVLLWEQLLPFAGDLNFCVSAVNLAEDSTITIKGKTSIYTLQILKSPTGEDALIDVSSTKEDLQKAIDDGINEAATSLREEIASNVALIQKEITDRKAEDTVLQTNIDKKVDKMIGAGDMVYAVDTDGTNVGISYTENNTSYSILRRDENGRASITAPLLDTEITNKKYVDDTIASQVSSVYKAKGSVADLSSLPTPDKAHDGFVYNIENEFTTTDLFVEGAGKTYPAGTNVVIVNTTGTKYKYDVLAGMVDLSSYATKTELSGKVDKVSTSNVVYATGSSGTQTPTKYTSEPTPYTMMYRTANGVVSVGTPTADTHATPKSYVDTADALKMNKSAFDYNDTTKTLTIDMF